MALLDCFIVRRSRRSAVLAGLVCAGVAAPAWPQEDAARFERLGSSPAMVAGALGGIVNPALWRHAQGEFVFVRNTGQSVDDWTVALGGPLGFAVDWSPDLWRYQVGGAWGDRDFAGGAAWKWARGRDGPDTESGLVLGWLYRPDPRLSFGFSTFLSAESDARTQVYDFATRPLGTTVLTLSADWTVQTSDDDVFDGNWSAGAETRRFGAFQLGAHVRERPGTDELEYVFTVGLGGDTFQYLGHLDQDGNQEGRQAVLFRANSAHRTVYDRPGGNRGNRLVVLDLEGKSVGYRKAQWFDPDRVAWLDLVRVLRDAREDDDVRGVALNLSATRIRPSILWEMREELARFRSAGKRVFIQIERPRMSKYYLASVADHISIDPYGWVDVTGVSARRTYWKGFLDKVGVGFEEYRYFSHKTANQRYTRTDLSDADRQQLGRFVNVVWDEFAAGIAAKTGLTKDQVAVLGDHHAILRPDQAQEHGLVDAVGSWEELRESDAVSGFAWSAPRTRRTLPEERWSEPPVLAVVYASGGAEMDAGFRGRATGEHLRRLAIRGDVAGVVLRSDSPGGDPMAANHITLGMQKIREANKPMVVSQGDVAASAGYSICLESDRIYTTPLTITGSIGVIAGWAWDAGLGEKTGFSADGVQRGRHADLWSGIRFPFVRLPLPQREMTDDEKAIVKTRILSMYDDFVARVAEARSLSNEEVREIGEGRIWMGGDAAELGLVDAFGTLGDALADARERAGLGPDDEVRYEEYPPRKLFRLPPLFPSLPGLSWLLPSPDGAIVPLERDETPEFLRLLLSRPGEPLSVVPPGQLPVEWDFAE